MRAKPKPHRANRNEMNHLRKEIAMPIKCSRILFSLIAFIALAVASAFAQTDAQKGFATLKSMTGSWEGKTPDGHSAQVNFKVTSGGSAVMSEILGHNADGMISMFHLDGPNRLLMTHYCSSGNQPRMSASVSPDGKTMTFKFVDVTNLDSPDAGHMQDMVLTLVDDNHQTEEWTFVNHGKEMKEVFDLHRKI
jgi:hypothetical protein